MRTGSRRKTSSFSIKERLSKRKVNALSKRLGFEKRKSPKITCYLLLLSFFDRCGASHFSLSNWAIQLGNHIGKSVSKQALYERINPRLEQVLKSLIGDSINERFSIVKNSLLCRFANIYLQDSSCLALPDPLRSWFKGNYSRGKIKSVAKLQVVFNMTKGVFSGLWLTPYSRNDQAASADIIPLLRKGDLVIRDLGYFVLKVLAQILHKQAHFVSRLKSEVVIFDYKTEKQISLKKVLGKKTYVKKRIFLGKNERLPVWLIAVKLDDAVARGRRIKIRKDRDRRKQITIEKLELAGWNIFVTSVEDLSAQEVSEIYRLRWQIEIIFKSWKTHLKIENNISPNLKKPQLFCTMILMTLLFVVLIVMPIYRIITTKLKKAVSVLKLTQILVQILPNIIHGINGHMLNRIAYHASYEQRKRDNIPSKIWKLA